MIYSVICWTRLLVTLVLASVLSLPTGLKTGHQNDFNPELDDFVPADRYLTHDEMITWLQNIAQRHPKIAKTFSIGKNEQDREILVLELSHSIGRGERALHMPIVKLVAGNIHGNEVVGRKLLLRTISHLIQNDHVDDKITRLLNTTDILFLPSMNPDGFVKAREEDCWSGGSEKGRLNANRDFPADQFKPEDKLLRSQNEILQGIRASEIQAAMKWILDNPFVLSASLHGGAVDAAPNDKGFHKFSQDYADRHPLMKQSDTNDVNNLNGAYCWYDLRKGGTRDFNYVHSNAFEVTLELSCCKYAPASRN